MNTAGVNKTLITNMFHPDFKYHLKAIDALSEVENLFVNKSDRSINIKFIDTIFGNIILGRCK